MHLSADAPAMGREQILTVSTVRFTISTVYYCGFYFRDFSGVISLVMFDTTMTPDALWST